MPEILDCESAKNFKRLMRDTEIFFGIPQDSVEAFAKFERLVEAQCANKNEQKLPFFLRKQAM